MLETTTYCPVCKQTAKEWKLQLERADRRERENERLLQIIGKLSLQLEEARAELEATP